MKAMCGLLYISIVLHSLANFTFTMSVSSNSFLNFKVIVSIAKDDK